MKKPPTEAIYIKNCLGDVLDVITCAKFQNEIFRGYDFTGDRIFHFPIDFSMGLTTVQRYGTKGDTMLEVEPTGQRGYDRSCVAGRSDQNVELC